MNYNRRYQKNSVINMLLAFSYYFYILNFLLFLPIINIIHYLLKQVSNNQMINYYNIWLKNRHIAKSNIYFQFFNNTNNITKFLASRPLIGSSKK